MDLGVGEGDLRGGSSVRKTCVVGLLPSLGLERERERDRESHHKTMTGWPLFGCMNLLDNCFRPVGVGVGGWVCSLEYQLLEISHR